MLPNHTAALVLPARWSQRLARSAVAAALAALVLTSAEAATPRDAAKRLEARASSGVTVRTSGPRTGAQGSRFFNVEGKNNGDDSSYASFGILDFTLPRPEGTIKAITSVSLTLTQSPARFSRDGAVVVHLAPDASAATAEGKSTLKFDTRVDGGIGKQIPDLKLLGNLSFKTGEKGQADVARFTPNGAAGDLLRERLQRGEPIRLVIVPADADVAATYAGTDHDPAEQRPTLTVEFEPAS